MIPISIEIRGLRLGRGQNDREGWQARARRVKQERTQVHSAIWRRYLGMMPGDPSEFRAAAGPGPWSITVTRVSPSPTGLDGHDNLQASCKAVVDELAAWLGVNDGNRARVEWRHAQERGAWAVRVRIESATPAAVTSVTQATAPGVAS